MNGISATKPMTKSILKLPTLAAVKEGLTDPDLEFVWKGAYGWYFLEGKVGLKAQVPARWKGRISDHRKVTRKAIGAQVGHATLQADLVGMSKEYPHLYEFAVHPTSPQRSCCLSAMRARHLWN